MEGLTKEELKVILEGCNAQYEHKELYRALLEACKELNPWLPIESAPENR